MKTEHLFKYYRSLFLEQNPEGLEEDPGAAPEENAAPMTPVGGPTKPLQENEKYVIKILTNAFIFNPTMFDKNKQTYIARKTDEIYKMINVPVAKIVDEIKRIISLDSSLRVESKTLALFKKYNIILEQERDATEPQKGSTAPDNNDKQVDQEQTTGEGNSLNLAEIFPLYKELIIKALRHAPTEDELMIIKPIVNEFADSDPEKIVEAIQNILSQSSEDREIRDDLSNV